EGLEGLEGLEGSRVCFHLSPETLAVTTAASWRVGQNLNLERSLKWGDELGGHVVSGHVDGVGELATITKAVDAWQLGIALPSALAGMVAVKGSIAINGCSLTVNKIGEEMAGDGKRTIIDITLIPHTITHTCFQFDAVGDKVNIEVDMLFRYVKRALDMMK
ncbi:MAG: hypothetical protein ORN57_01830, partial [Alphaproteobacteria bacterium]|nr:hypothetical protein [Alphaproteobacteria bacterium]